MGLLLLSVVYPVSDTVQGVSGDHDDTGLLLLDVSAQGCSVMGDWGLLSAQAGSSILGDSMISSMLGMAVEAVVYVWDMGGVSSVLVISVCGITAGEHTTGSPMWARSGPSMGELYKGRQTISPHDP